MHPAPALLSRATFEDEGGVPGTGAGGWRAPCRPVEAGAITVGRYVPELVGPDQLMGPSGVVAAAAAKPRSAAQLDQVLADTNLGMVEGPAPGKPGQDKVVADRSLGMSDRPARGQPGRGSVEALWTRVAHVVQPASTDAEVAGRSQDRRSQQPAGQIRAGRQSTFENTTVRRPWARSRMEPPPGAL
jgi:hypothetical protein